MHSDIAAIVINWNTAPHLRRCLDSFLREGLVAPDLIVVDQGSTDGSVELVHASFPEIQVVSLADNSGYAHAVNVGMTKTSKPFVVVANADVVLKPGCLETLRRVIQSHDNVALVGPRLVNVDETVVTRLSRTSVARGILLEVFPRRLRGLWRDTERLVREKKEPFNVTFVEGALMLLRREPFVDIGGMDEGFSFFFEDADLPLRFLKAGYRIMHVPGAVAVHVGGASFSQVPERHAAEFYRNMIRLYRRHAFRKAKFLKVSLSFLLRAKILCLRILQRVGFSVSGRIERNEVIRSSITLTPVFRAKEHPLVSIIVPTYNRPQRLARLLNLLEAQTYRNCEVIVVDQSESPAPLRSEKLAFSMIHLRPGIRNRSVAKNRGASAAKGDILLFCDDDIEPDRNFVQTHVDVHREEGVAAVSCRVVEEGLPPLSTTNICRITWYGKMIDRYQSDVSCDVETMVGGNMSIKVDAFREAGYFDAIFRGTSIFEEQDLSERLRALRWRILFTNASTVKHVIQPDGNVGIRSAAPARYYHDFHHNELVFFLKNRNHALLVFVIPFCLLRSIKQAMIYRLSFRDSLHILAGVISGIRSYYASLR